MKKFLIFMLSISILSNVSSQILESEKINNHVSQSQEIPKELDDLKIKVQKLQEFIDKENLKRTFIFKDLNILHKIASIFTFVVEKADKLLSKKFMIATLLVIAPVLTVYCAFFDITSIQNLFYWMSSQAAEKAAGVGAPLVTGAVTGTTKAILHDKVAIAEVVGIWTEIEVIKRIIKKIGETIAPKFVDVLGQTTNGLGRATIGIATLILSKFKSFKLKC